MLTVIGAASIKKTHHPSQLLFASIPFIFGVQQIAEGLLFIDLRKVIERITRGFIALFFGWLNQESVLDFVANIIL